MSMPKFPEIDPEITCAHALNMILVSIAMEELALSHIINAEGEKLQYVLRALEKNCGRELAVDEVLAVNQSIANLLDSVSQNQIILKNKMDKALHALSETCREQTCKNLCKCSGVFKAEKKHQLWCAGSSLCWDTAHLRGRCIAHDPCDKTKVELRAPKRRFEVSFAVNARTKSACKCDEPVSISLQMTNHEPRKEIYTVRAPAPYAATATISMGGIIVETSEHYAHSVLSLKLMSDASLMVESAILNVMEITC